MSLRRTRKTLPKSPTDYPNGTFFKTEKGYFYAVSRMKRYRIISERVLASWSPPRVVQTTEAAVRHYRIAAKMKFRNGSLIYSISDGRIYLIVDGKRCPVVSPDFLERMGSSLDDKSIITVSKDELELHELGDELS